MRHQRIHPHLVRPEKCLSPARRQCHGATRTHEIPCCHHSRVHRREHRRIHNQRTKRLHQIQRQRRTSKARLMVKPHVRIKTHRVACHRQILRQQAVPQGQHRVDRVPRWTSVPPVHFERQRVGPRLLVRLHHTRELPKVYPRRIPLDSQQLLQRSGHLRPLRHLLHARQRLPLRLHVIPL